jgi:hypothetical protein
MNRFLAATLGFLSFGYIGCGAEPTPLEVNLRLIGEHVTTNCSERTGEGRCTLTYGGGITVTNTSEIDWDGSLNGVKFMFYDTESQDCWVELDGNGYEDESETRYYHERLRLGKSNYSFLQDSTNGYVRNRTNELLEKDTEKIMRSLGLSL